MGKSFLNTIPKSTLVGWYEHKTHPIDFIAMIRLSLYRLSLYRIERLSLENLGNIQIKKT